LVSLDLRNQSSRNIVMMPSMATLAAVCDGELDPVSLDAIDSTNMNAVGADDFHVLAYGI
jgi:hypothetical protein